MTARQSAISRVAAGIVPPTQYRGASCTAQLASGCRMDTEVDYQTPREPASSNPLRPVQEQAPPSGPQSQVRALCTALALLLTVLTSVGPGLGESPKVQNETLSEWRGSLCPQDYKWIALDPNVDVQQQSMCAAKAALQAGKVREDAAGQDASPPHGGSRADCAPGAAERARAKRARPKRRRLSSGRDGVSVEVRLRIRLKTWYSRN